MRLYDYNFYLFKCGVFQVTLSRLKDSSSPGSNLREATGVGLSNHPQLPESHLAPTQDTRVTHQRHQQASLPPNLPVNIPSSLQVMCLQLTLIRSVG